MARLITNGGGTTIDVPLVEFKERERVPEVVHRTPYGTRLRYSLDKRWREGECVFRVTTNTDYDAFLSFYRNVMDTGLRFTFYPDFTNFSSDSWSAMFESEPEFTRLKRVGDFAGEFRVTISDDTATLP